MSKVHVAGTGLISAIGHSVEESFQSLKKEKTGVGPLTLFESFHKNLPVAEIKKSNEELADILGVTSQQSRTTLLGLIAAREALKNSGIKSFKKWRSGFISATTVGGMDRTETFFPEFLSDSRKGKLRDIIHHPCGSSTDVIASDLMVNGFRSTVNTACSSSVNSIMLGCRMINGGLIDVVIAGGSDALTKFTLNGFNSLMILDKEPCRPFDASRSGLNLGEGAGFVVLVSEQVVKDEKLNPVCFVSGFGNATDAYHQTASSPEGRGSFSAMQLALKMSKLKGEDIDYINLHGTGTVNNDLSEGTAVKRLFGDRLTKMSSTKAFTGHTLGASGGIEAVFSVLAIINKCVYPNLRFQTTMPEHGITPQKKFEEVSMLDHVMSNSFGFGGNCSSIIFSKN
jgi:3-oxoacyl-[acyl-carrier-protein] synthase-1